MYLVSDLANEALDAIGWPRQIDDIEDGSTESRVMNRAYWQCRRQLLRASHWAFARKKAPMLMLADCTGQTPNVGNLVCGPFTYEYAYPTDCLKARFVPWNDKPVGTSIPQGNIAIPGTALYTNMDNQPPGLGRMRVARFLLTSDTNYPPSPGQQTWEVSGESPQQRQVILTNVNQADLVYTADVLYPSVFDPLFRSALVSFMAATVCMKLWAQREKEAFGLQMLGAAEQATKAKIAQARAMSNQEGVPTSSIRTDWIDTRKVQGSGGGWWGWGPNGSGGGGDGCDYGGWDSLALPSGAVF